MILGPVRFFSFLCVLAGLCTSSLLFSQEPPKRIWTQESSKRVVDLYLKVQGGLAIKDYKLATKLSEELCALDDEPGDYYDLACLYSKAGRFDEAMKNLSASIVFCRNNPTIDFVSLLRDDEDLAPLRKRADFAKLVQQAERGQWKPSQLEYEANAAQPVAFMRCGQDQEYLTNLRTKYKLETLIEGCRGDLERVKILCTWVHTRWNHVGEAKNHPNDPTGLLDAALTGDNFRCVEYGVTVAGCLNAIGIPARVVGATARDVETRRFGAGHVFAEAWLSDQQKWVFVDPQTNMVGQLDGKPLNTVEFVQALAEPHSKLQYNFSLASCLYYLCFGLDWRYPISARKAGDVLLAPKGAPIPTVFQRIYPSEFTMSTHNPADVYGPPPAIKMEHR